MMLAEHLIQRVARRIFRPDRLQPPFQDLLLLQALARRACAQGLLHDAADGLRRPHRRRREQRGGRCRAQQKHKHAPTQTHARHVGSWHKPEKSAHSS